MGNWARANLAPGAHVTSDGLGCFAAVLDAGCVHMPVVVGVRKPRELPQIAWVNTILGNLKTSLQGAYHSLGWAKHADNYLAAFAYRFNRRFDLLGLLARLSWTRRAARPIGSARFGVGPRHITNQEEP